MKGLNYGAPLLGLAKFICYLPLVNNVSDSSKKWKKNISPVASESDTQLLPWDGKYQIS